MTEAAEAAKAKIGVWRAHDEKDIEGCRDSASKFYETVTDADSKDLDYAGEMVRRAFWLADEAEKYQETDKKKENFFYDCAENCLREAFNAVGLAEETAEHRRNW